MTTRVPVTVLTGFLGAGKTTLVNRILSENHGKRIAVIENEFGEIGVDQALVIGAEEEIFETSNGCICCTVRGDLIRILTQLRKRRDRFDAILIETTGLADPGPVAQTFFIDEDLKEHFRLDAIVTLVDARHVEQELKDSAVAQDQIAFADVVLLNKTDLVDAGGLERIERHVRAINGTARLIRTHNADVPLDRVLDIGAFDLSRALAQDAAFLEPARPFEWAGLYQFAAGAHRLDTGADDHDHAHDHDHEHEHEHEEHDHDHGHGGLEQVDLGVLKANGGDAAALDALIGPASALFELEPVAAQSGVALAPGKRYRLPLKHASHFHFEAPAAGHWAIFTEHGPAEFGLRVAGQPLQQRTFGSHHHDLAVGSIGIEDDRPLDPNKTNEWLSYLLQSHGQDIMRMKGVLNFKGEARRYVFHGVHMMFDGQLERPWASGQARRSQLVFIGRNLDRKELEAGFESCLA